MNIKEIDYGISGIYKVIFQNDKLYIGLSNDIRRRMIEHVGKDLKEHPELMFSKAYLKHGIKSIEILELQLEGKKRMDYKSFLLGHHIDCGTNILED